MIGKLSILLFFGFLIYGCGRSTDDLVLAKVKDKEITAKDLRKFADNLPEHYKAEKPGIEGYEEYLQTMVDKELLLLEAEARGIDKSQYFIDTMDGIKRSKLINAIVKKYVSDKITITEDEMQQYMVDEKFNREIRGRRIVVETKEDADSVMAELAKGRSFQEVAKERSIDEFTSEKGGDLEKFYGKHEVYGPLADVVFDLEVGGISDPVDTPAGYHISQIIEERFVDLQQVRHKVHSSLRRQKFLLGKAELIEELREEYGLKLNSQGLDILLSLRDPAAELPEDQKKIPLYEYGGGSITVQDYLSAFRTSGLRSFPKDRIQVEALASRH